MAIHLHCAHIVRQALKDGSVFGQKEADGTTLYYMKSAYINHGSAREQSFRINEGFKGKVGDKQFEEGLGSLMDDWEAGWDLSKPMSLEETCPAQPHYAIQSKTTHSRRGGCTRSPRNL